MDRARSRNARTAYLDADTAFHEAFFACCGNPCLIETYALHVGKIAASGRTSRSSLPIWTSRMPSTARCWIFCEADAWRRALNVLDRHIARTKLTYASGVEDIAAADRAAEERSHTTGRQQSVRSE